MMFSSLLKPSLPVHKLTHITSGMSCSPALGEGGSRSQVVAHTQFHLTFYISYVCYIFDKQVLKIILLDYMRALPGIQLFQASWHIQQFSEYPGTHELCT